jgi:hypothetical protein
MTVVRVAILPVRAAGGVIAYRAVAGEHESEGRTAGEALDALMLQMPEDERTALSIDQTLPADRFFGLEQQERLAELMTQWRQARDSGATLPDAQEAELEALIDDEVRAAALRAARMLRREPQ